MDPKCTGLEPLSTAQETMCTILRIRLTDTRTMNHLAICHMTLDPCQEAKDRKRNIAMALCLGRIRPMVMVMEEEAGDGVCQKPQVNGALTDKER